MSGWDWVPVSDGDDRARGIFHRHYSYRRYADGRNPRLFVGPGEKGVLLTLNCQALFVWRKFINASGEEGVNCSVFRNEGGHGCLNSQHDHCSSNLIRRADEYAWQRWPGQRHYTYVNPKRISSANPGYCFKRAGWNECGKTKGGLVVLSIAAPDPEESLS